MTSIRPKTILTISAIILLVTASVTSSDARPHAKRLSPNQKESVYYNSTPTQDNSCFYSTGLPEIYACSSHGG